MSPQLDLLGFWLGTETKREIWLITDLGRGGLVVCSVPAFAMSQVRTPL